MGRIFSYRTTIRLASAMARSEGSEMNQEYIDSTMEISQQFSEELSHEAVWDETFSDEGNTNGKEKEKERVGQ